MENTLNISDKKPVKIVTFQIDQSTKDSCQWKSYLWRIANFVMAIFFILAAYVQLNDPDPYLWMAVYAIPALLCLVIVFTPNYQHHIVWQSLATANVFGSFAGAIYLATRIKPIIQKQEIKNPLALEEGREMAGLLISMFWISVCKIVNWFNQSQWKTSSSSPLKVNSDDITLDLLTRKNKLSLSFWILILILCLIPFTLWAYCYRTLESHMLPDHCKDML